MDRLRTIRADENELVNDCAQAVRAACIEAAIAGYERAAIAGYERAAISGLCREGAFEAAISAIRMVDLDKLIQARQA